MTDKKLILSTTGSREEAQKIARALVERKLAACVNIVGPIESVYRWQGAVQRDEESLLLVKTAAERFDALRGFILSRHPYELPEVVAVKLDHAHTRYLEWVLENSR